MVDITPYITALVMLLGILVGTLITPKVNQQVSMQHNRKDLIFKKKLEYFEKVTETIEKNKKLYHNIIKQLEENNSAKKVNEVLQTLKENRSKFSAMTSPLYLDIKILSEKIIGFVALEKDIFNKILGLKEAKKEEKEQIISMLKENSRRLKRKGEEIICEMKKELSKN